MTTPNNETKCETLKFIQETSGGCLLALVQGAHLIPFRVDVDKELAERIVARFNFCGEVGNDFLKIQTLPEICRAANAAFDSHSAALSTERAAKEQAERDLELARSEWQAAIKIVDAVSSQRDKAITQREDWMQRACKLRSERDEARKHYSSNTSVASLGRIITERERERDELKALCLSRDAEVLRLSQYTEHRINCPAKRFLEKCTCGLEKGQAT